MYAAGSIADTVKRILLVMMQPPGSSGVQGLIYNKILPYLETSDWEFHFAGPSPELTSILAEEVDCPPSRLHYTNSVSWSLRFSVLKNRHRQGTLPFYLYGLLQLVARSVERLVRHDSRQYLISGLMATIRQAEQQWNFDLIAGKSPDFAILEAVADQANSLNKPLVAMVDDPYGKRDGAIFLPYEMPKQKRILDQCCGAIFMSPLTLQRYVECGLVGREKAYAFTDSFPSYPHLYQGGLALSWADSGKSQQAILHLVHLGMLPEWRPIEALLEALEQVSLPVLIDVYGYVYPEARQSIRSSPRLRSQIRCNKPVSYYESHHIAEDSSVMLVIIGPRHLDNQPSKFFEYLGHRKPILVLGPIGNPIQAIVNRLGIGIYCDILDSAAIAAAITRLVDDRGDFVWAYEINKKAIDVYSAPQVARLWVETLQIMLDTTTKKTF
ncbi:MAG: hypothetical protein WCL59_06675 [Cyanobium sp. ELA507]